MTPYSEWSSACENDHELSHAAAQPSHFSIHCILAIYIAKGLLKAMYNRKHKGNKPTLNSNAEHNLE